MILGGLAVMAKNPVVKIVTAIAAWEAFWWFRRRLRRGTMFREARARATYLGRPLVVVGAPDRGPTAGYPCGDYTVDIQTSSCPKFVQADITKRLPFPNDSVVVFVSCVLEYVSDLPAAMRELARVSGGELYVVRVEPWTLTAYWYPGTKRRLPADWRTIPGAITPGIKASFVKRIRGGGARWPRTLFG